jgi:hypothetical protein
VRSASAVMPLVTMSLQVVEGSGSVPMSRRVTR